MRILFALCLAAAAAALPAASSAAPPPGLTVPAGFNIDVIAHVPRARELAFAPNGDLFVGTSGRDVYIVPQPENGGSPAGVFVSMDDGPAASAIVHGGMLYVGTQHGVWRMLYTAGDRTAQKPPEQIAALRPLRQGHHITTSLAIAGNRLYAGVGSTCNACAETDPTVASIQEMTLDGRGMHAKAIRIRNPIALAVNPVTGTLWAGVAGQDELAHGHPYEIFDAITLRPGTVDYFWPHCYEDRKAAAAGDSCASAPISRAVFPAYETPIGAVFYPAAARGAHAFPKAFAGGAFVTLHGSWHLPLVPPRVVFVPMRADDPLTPVNWNDPAVQWTDFIGGFQNWFGSRSGRPTGIAVGPEGSLFVADDQSGAIYRVRPA